MIYPVLIQLIAALAVLIFLLIFITVFLISEFNFFLLILLLFAILLFVLMLREINLTFKKNKIMDNSLEEFSRKKGLEFKKGKNIMFSGSAEGIYNGTKIMSGIKKNFAKRRGSPLFLFFVKIDAETWDFSADIKESISSDYWIYKKLVDDKSDFFIAKSNDLDYVKKEIHPLLLEFKTGNNMGLWIYSLKIMKGYIDVSISNYIEDVKDIEQCYELAEKIRQKLLSYKK